MDANYPEIIHAWIALICFSAANIFLLSAVLYRIYWHPLSAYQGPFLCKFTGIPTLFHAWKGDLHHYLYRLHQQYGTHVRYSTNKISIKSVEVMNDIYGFNKNSSKPEEFYAAFRVNKDAVNTFNTSSKEMHRRKRRIMAKAFSESALKSYETFICSQVDAFLKKLLADDGHESEYGPRVYNLGYEFNCLMLDIMGGLCFGEEFGFVAGRGKEVLAQAHQREIRIFITAHEPMLKLLRLDRIFFPRLWAASQALGEYAKRNTNLRISKYHKGLENESQAQGQGYEDIMSHLLGAGDEESGTTYSDDELLGEGILMMMAGSDTSSSALGATVFYLAHNLLALERVKAELAEHLPTTAKDIQPQHAEKCQFLRACIDEAMRMSPPAPTIIPRLVGPGGMIVGDDHFPEGVCVGVPNFALFHDERYFSRPHDYIPERWLHERDNKKIDTHDSAAFLPFSMGPRGCIGKHLAIKEVSFILAKFLRTFDIERVGSNCVLQPCLNGMEGKVIMEQSDVYTSLENGPLLQLRPRESLQHRLTDQN